MDTAPFRMRLSATPAALSALLAGLSDADARWQPADGGWSIVEILGHLSDEDELDFGARLRLLLETPRAAWPDIDPETTVQQRGHVKRKLAEQLAAFAAQRKQSLEWLAAYSAVEDRPVHEHPALGRLSPADLLANWTAHDLLHTRQLATRLWQLVERDAGGRHLDYAGDAPT
ncbi:MAG: hypothetical protein DHS20C15_25430 [Planctomycetota bacterium]|nr:MAG: hypothetical protein DHS20C15_25430 [Planctomycetota bacterium]